MKTLLKNGLIADGSGKPLYKADVLLSGNVIEKIAENVVAEDAEIVDCTGLIVAPGFTTRPMRRLQNLTPCTWNTAGIRK